MPDLDRALEHCEEQILEQTSQRTDDAVLLREIFAEGLETVCGYLETVQLATGQVLFHEGEAPNGLYFLEVGRASVWIREPPSRLRTFPQDTILGELGHYAQTPRSATVRADVPCTLQYLSTQEYERLERENPALAGRLARYLVVLLAERLRHREMEMQSRD